MVFAPMNKTKVDQYSEQEIQHRFEGLVKAALNTPPKPLKSMTKKGTVASKNTRQRAKRRPARA